MNVPAMLVACYPPPVRARWGAQLHAEVEHAGPRDWANVAVSAIGLWLNPSMWPAPTVQRRRAVLTVTGAIIVGTAALILRAPGEDPPAALASAVMTAAGCGLCLATALLCPVPPLSRRGLTQVARRAIQTLWVPAFLIVSVIAFARRPDIDILLANPDIRAAAFLMYWLTLIIGVVQACRLCSWLLTTATPPPARWRVVAGLRLIGASLLVAASARLIHTDGAQQTMPSATTALLLVVLAAVAIRNSTADVQLAD